VKAKAMRKLEELVEQAINEAEKLLIDPLLEPADKIKIIDTVFDRTFYPKISRRELEVERITYDPEKDPERIELLRQAREALANQEPKQGGVYELENTIDAEVVE